MGVGQQTWLDVPARKIDGSRLAYTCGLPTFVSVFSLLSADKAEQLAFLRLNDFYKKLATGKNLDFAMAMECGEAKACEARWLPALMGGKRALATEWQSLIQKTQIAKSVAPSAAQSRSMMIDALGELMREDCAGNRNVYPGNDEVLLDGEAQCQHLRAGTHVTKVEGRQLFKDSTSLQAMVDACRERQQVRLGLQDQSEMRLSCRKPYQAMSQFYAFDIDRIFRVFGY